MITGGPANGATVASSTVAFSFRASAGGTTQCSVDQQPFRSCSGGTQDLLRSLPAGFHSWVVQVRDAGNDVGIAGRTFDVA